jgi:hypothetical protein
VYNEQIKKITVLLIMKEILIQKQPENILNNQHALKPLASPLMFAVNISPMSAQVCSAIICSYTTLPNIPASYSGPKLKKD